MIDEMFTTQEQRDDAKREKVLDIPLAEIDAFPDHPFHVKTSPLIQSQSAAPHKYTIRPVNTRFAVTTQKENPRSGGSIP
jgi:ParB family chromosome partitioning protein